MRDQCLINRVPSERRERSPLSAIKGTILSLFTASRLRAERLRHTPLNHQLQVDVEVGQIDQVLDGELRVEFLRQNLRVRYAKPE